MSRRSCAIAVMAKASQPGRTKTRLVPPLTHEEAAAFNTAFLQDVAGNLIAASVKADIAGYMAYGPPGSEPFFEAILPGEIGLIESWQPNFGDCLFRAAAVLLGSGYACACVLNADSPTLPTSLLVETAERLAAPGDRIVLGPSNDGGYYLLGLKRSHRRLFDDIDWSTERVAGQTLERAAELGLEVVMLPEWYDVDDAQALRTLAGEVLAGRSYGGEALVPYPAPHTGERLRALLRQDGAAARLGLDALTGVS